MASPCLQMDKLKVQHSVLKNRLFVVSVLLKVLISLIPTSAASAAKIPHSHFLNVISTSECLEAGCLESEFYDALILKSTSMLINIKLVFLT